MKKIILFLLVLIGSYVATGQVLRPAGNPTVNTTGWYNIGFTRDSAKLFILHDTFPARYPSVVWHPDGNFYKTLGGVGAFWSLFIPNTPSSGTVTSVGITGANGISVANSPITVSGNIALTIPNLSTGQISATGVAVTGILTGSGATFTGNVSALSFSGSGGALTGVIKPADTSAMTDRSIRNNPNLQTPGTFNIAGVGRASSLFSLQGIGAVSYGFNNTSNVQRWAFLPLNNETGSGDVGYDNAIASFTDAGSFKQSVVTLRRSSGSATFVDSVVGGSFRRVGGTGAQMMMANGTVVDTSSVSSGYVRTIGIATANGVSGISSGGQNPLLTVTLGNITPSSVSVSGSATVTGTVTTSAISASNIFGDNGYVPVFSETGSSLKKSYILQDPVTGAIQVNTTAWPTLSSGKVRGRFLIGGYDSLTIPAIYTYYPFLPNTNLMEVGATIMGTKWGATGSFAGTKLYGYADNMIDGKGWFMLGTTRADGVTVKAVKIDWRQRVYIDSMSTGVAGVDSILVKSGGELKAIAPGSFSGGVTSVSGTSNQINSTGGTTPVLSISSTLVTPGTAVVSGRLTATGDITGANIFLPDNGAGAVPSFIDLSAPLTSGILPTPGSNHVRLAAQGANRLTMKGESGFLQQLEWSNASANRAFFFPNLTGEGVVTSGNQNIITTGNISAANLTATGNITGLKHITSGGTSSQVVLGDGTLGTYSNPSGFIPYSGATTDVNLGTRNFLSTGNITTTGNIQGGLLTYTSASVGNWNESIVSNRKVWKYSGTERYRFREDGILQINLNAGSGDGQIEAYGDGSNTYGAGPYLSLMNLSGTSGIAMQLNGNGNGLTYFNQSSTALSSLSNGGNLSVTGSITAAANTYSSGGYDVVVRNQTSGTLEKLVGFAPLIVSSGAVSAQTTTTVVASYTVTAGTGLYDIGGVLKITAGAGSISLDVIWTDESGTVNTHSVYPGTSGVGTYPGDARTVYAQNGSTIYLRATILSGSVTFNSQGYIQKMN